MSLSIANVQLLDSEKEIIADLRWRVKQAEEERKEKKEIEMEFLALKKNYFKLKTELKIFKD
jgi:hypothetical protein